MLYYWNKIDPDLSIIIASLKNIIINYWCLSDSCFSLNVIAFEGFNNRNIFERSINVVGIAKLARALIGWWNTDVWVLQFGQLSNIDLVFTGTWNKFEIHHWNLKDLFCSIWIQSIELVGHRTKCNIFFAIFESCLESVMYDFDMRVSTLFWLSKHLSAGSATRTRIKIALNAE